jgi:hypothetical protein
MAFRLALPKPSHRWPPLQESMMPEADEPLVLAELTVTQLVMAISDLHKIADETPALLSGEYHDLALASHRLSRVVQKLEATQKVAAE